VVDTPFIPRTNLPSGRRPILRIVAIVVGLVALLALIGWGISKTSWFRSLAPQETASQTIIMHEKNGTGVFALGDASLTPVPLAQSSLVQTAFYPREVAQSPGGAVVALGSPVATGHARIATVLQNGHTIPLALTGSEFKDLAVNETYAVFSTLIDATTTSARPVDAMKPRSTWYIAVTNIHTYDGYRELMPGEGAVFAPNGSLIAHNDHGLVRINPTTGSSVTLIDGVYASSTDVSLISPDLTFVVLPNTASHRADVFSIDLAHPEHPSFVGSLDSLPDALGALDPETFVARFGTSVIEYRIGTTTLTKLKSFSIGT
jgi:hypothetical protein